jgi:hypothetical protein
VSRPTAIRDVRCFEARSALSRPIADATHVIPAIEFVMCEIELAGGVVAPTRARPRDGASASSRRR